MLLEIVLIALGAATIGFGAALLLLRRRAKRLEKAADQEHVQPDDRFQIYWRKRDEPHRRATLIHTSASGAGARQFYERFQLVGDAIIEFYDGGQFRGKRKL